MSLRYLCSLQSHSPLSSIHTLLLMSTYGSGYRRDKLNIDFNFVRCVFPVSEEIHLIPFPISDW